MATNTENYELIKPDPDGFYSIAEFNSNSDKIDTALTPTADPVLIPGSNGPFKLVNWVSYFTNRIKAITGLANWWSTPNKSLKDLEDDLASHEADNTAHGTATKAEAQAGTSHASYMTPLRTKEAIQALQAVTSVAGRTGDITLTKSDVGLENAAKIAGGSYIGDGTQNRLIFVGFTPILVIVTSNAQNYQYIVTGTTGILHLETESTKHGKSTNVVIATNGFNVGNISLGFANTLNQTYEWIAIGG